MTYFLWFIAIVGGMSVIGSLYWLATGDYPARTPYQTAVNAVFDTVLCAWAVALLVAL